MKIIGQLIGFLIAACAIVGFALVMMAIMIAVPTFVGWFMGLAAAFMFGPWLEQGVHQLLRVDMSLDLLGAVLGFLFGLARLGLSAAKATITQERKSNE